MVRKESFPQTMGWKKGSVGDNKPDTDISQLDIENLDGIKPILLSSVKSIELEKAGLWTRVSNLSVGEDSCSVSKTGIGIELYIKLV